MAGRFTVESIFKGIDKISGPTKKMSRRVSKFTRKMGNSFRKLNAKIGGLTSTAKKAGLGIAAGLAIGTAALAGVVNTGADFEQSLLNASSKFGAGLQKDSAEFTSLFDSLEKSAASIGKRTEFTSKQAAEGLDFLALAGFTAEQAIAALPGLVDLATASQTDLARASDIASDTLGAFGLASKDAAERAANLQRVSDSLVKTTTTSNTSMEDLFEGIKKGGPAFTQAGQSMESFTTLMGVMANAGIKGSEAGTVLRNAVIRLSKPTKEAQEVLDEFNIKISDQDGNFRDIVSIMEDFQKATSKVGEVQRLAALAAVFGTRSVSGLSVVLKEGSASISDYRKSIENSSDSANTMAEIMRSGVGGGIKTMQSSLEGLILTFFRTNKEGFSKIISGITDWIRKVDLFLEKNEQMVSGLSGDLFQTIVAGLKIFAGFVAIVVALNAVLLVAKVGILAWNIAMAAFNVVMGIAHGIMVVVTAAQWAWNVAMSANPVGAIIALVVALAAVGFLLIKNWDQVKAFFISTWDSIVDTVRSSIAAISGLIETVTQPFKDLTQGVSGIKAKVSNFFGFSGGESGKTVSQQDRISRSISESRETSQTEVTIKAEKGTSAEITNRRGKGRGLTLQQSGAF